MVVRDAEAAGAEEKGRYGAANETRRREPPEGGQADGEPLTACTHGTHAKRADRDVGRRGVFPSGLILTQRHLARTHSALWQRHVTTCVHKVKNAKTSRQDTAGHWGSAGRGDASQPATLSDFQPKSCTSSFG